MSDDTAAIAGAIGTVVISAVGTYITNKLYVRYWVNPAIDKKLVAFETRHADVFAK